MRGTLIAAAAACLAACGTATPPEPRPPVAVAPAAPSALAAPLPREAAAPPAPAASSAPAVDPNPSVAPGLVAWHADFDAARAASARSGKPVLLFAMLGNLEREFC